MANVNKTGRSTGPSTKATAQSTTSNTPVGNKTGDQGGDSDGEGDAPAAPVNPFATLPVLRAGDYEVHDLSKTPEGLTDAAPRKYEAVQAKARELSIQMKQGYKHANAVFKLGSVRDEKKPTTVMGMIQQIVKGYGKDGCPAIVLVTRLREAAHTNTRSHFCQGKLPPVGWAEGYVDGAINQNLIKVDGQMANEIAAKSLVAVAAPAEGGEATEQKQAAA
jgi:predicted short-subunit dehydrogenase-like oxidoreductase (DUF2520 family)